MNLLVISSSCPHSGTANGKTIANISACLNPKETYAFYWQRMPNATGFDEKSFCVSDGDALSYLLHRKKRGCQATSASVQSPHKNKNAFQHLLRFYVWLLSPWKRHGFKKWMSSIKPDAILLYLTDSIYHIKFSLQLTQSLHIPLLVFTGENYCFKRFDYLMARIKPGLFYRLFQRKLYRISKKACQCASALFFNSESLMKEYEKHFGTACKSLVIMPPSKLSPKSRRLRPIRRIVYGGNYGLKRYVGICELADEMNKLCPDAVIDVFGSGDETGNRELSSRNNIHMHGYVANEELEAAMFNADLLFHCESFDPYYSEDLKFSFSTKIAESLMSGVPFMLYAPAGFAGTQYCQSIKGPFVATSKEELFSTLFSLVNGRYTYDLDIETMLCNHRIESIIPTVQTFLRNLGLSRLA